MNWLFDDNDWTDIALKTSKDEDIEAISVPMTGWTVSEPLGLSEDSMPEVSSIFPKYGSFYLVRDI